VDSDKGVPFVMAHSDSLGAKAFVEIVQKVEAYLNENEKPKT
jgi:MinD-like ATPase involved in chromosome partitioning or flagellar assembly